MRLMIAAAFGAILLIAGWFDVLWAQNAMFDLQAVAHTANADGRVLAALGNLYTAGRYGIHNYIARSLLATGGFRPGLHPALLGSRSSWGSAEDTTETGNQ
ncbi:hypothetical protein AB0C02_33065 [Micromonospora sp. NPDC048999]|uniref:hypothetical protein n=1 Tax=Micromonospora sp. NPDC048999 TaxID=3155391 RepID=UPI0033DD21BF